MSQGRKRSAMSAEDGSRDFPRFLERMVLPDRERGFAGRGHHPAVLRGLAGLPQAGTLASRASEYDHGYTIVAD
jgi:hypothetical protein